MITYKNITDVEVLEQASENTKVLVNEGGELMQAPYSNFEDKMKDAEVLEEIPENAKVLVSDNGVLKQAELNKKEIAERVVVFHYDENHDHPTCNLTFEEFDVLWTQQKIVGFTMIKDNDTSSDIYGHAPAEVFMSDDYYVFNVDYGGVRFELYPDNHVVMITSPK